MGGRERRWLKQNNESQSPSSHRRLADDVPAAAALFGVVAVFVGGWQKDNKRGPAVLETSLCRCERPETQRRETAKTAPAGIES